MFIRLRNLNRLSTLTIFLVSVFGVIDSAYCQDAEDDDLPEYIKAHYTKYEYTIAARDGVGLFTAVYVPKDDSREYAIMFLRTRSGN